MTGVRRCIGFLLFSFLVLVPSSATAHSSSVETNPDDGATLESLPAEATVTFNEAPKTADVVLARPDGEIRKLRAQVAGSTIRVRLPTDGRPGRYQLSYRVVSADGHPVSGTITFTVAKGSAGTVTVPVEPTPTAEPTRGPFVAIVIGVALLGVAASVLVARSLRR
jgi:methionine-rich copper-binding protein CopC